MKLSLLAASLALVPALRPDAEGGFDSWRSRLGTPPVSATLNFSIDLESLGISPGELARPGAELIEDAQERLDAGEETLEVWAQMVIGCVREGDDAYMDAWQKVGELFEARMVVQSTDEEAWVTVCRMLVEVSSSLQSGQAFGMADDYLNQARDQVPSSAELLALHAELYVWTKEAWHNDPDRLDTALDWARDALRLDPENTGPLYTIQNGLTGQLHLRYDKWYGVHADGLTGLPGMSQGEALAVFSSFTLELTELVEWYTEVLPEPGVARGYLYSFLLPIGQTFQWITRVENAASSELEPLDDDQIERLTELEAELAELVTDSTLGECPEVFAWTQLSLWSLRCNLAGELADTSDLDEVVDDLPNAGNWIEMRLLYWIYLEQFDQALSVLDDLEQYIAEDRWLMLSGRLHFAEKEPELARKAFENVDSSGEYAEIANVGIAFCRLSQGEDAADALEVLEEASEEPGARPKVHFACAVAYALEGRFNEAHDAATNALAGRPEEEKYAEFLAEVEAAMEAESEE